MKIGGLWACARVGLDEGRLVGGEASRDDGEVEGTGWWAEGA
jgi:hypothetical protein